MDENARGVLLLALCFVLGTLGGWGAGLEWAEAARQSVGIVASLTLCFVVVTWVHWYTGAGHASSKH